MEYREFLPSLALREHVEHFWVISSDGNAAPQDAGTILPDGGVELVLSFADPITRRTSGATAGERLRHMVVGQMDRRSGVNYHGKVDLIGVRFQPAGAVPFFDAPLRELTGQIVHLPDLAPWLGSRIDRELDPEWPISIRVSALERFLLERINSAFNRDLIVEQAVKTIQRHDGRVTVSKLMEKFELSGRQLERRFQRAVGLPPKLLCRILRFRRAWDTICQTASPDWADLALGCGYYDQAHLLRDFREFAGGSPTQLVPTWDGAA